MKIYPKLHSFLNRFQLSTTEQTSCKICDNKACFQWTMTVQKNPKNAAQTWTWIHTLSIVIHNSFCPYFRISPPFPRRQPRRPGVVLHEGLADVSTAGQRHVVGHVRRLRREPDAKSIHQIDNLICETSDIEKNDVLMKKFLSTL